MHAYVSRFDEVASMLVRAIPAWATPFMHAVTLIGQPVCNIFVAAMIAVLAVSNGRQEIAYAAGATVIAMLGNTVLKNIFQRQRPDTLYVDNMLIKSYSFPSGHAFGAAVLYGLVAVLAYKYAPQPWNIWGPIFCGFLILSVGVSRIYLGAHFPSDVFIGWILGILSVVVIARVSHL